MIQITKVVDVCLFLATTDGTAINLHLQEIHCIYAEYRAAAATDFYSRRFCFIGFRGPMRGFLEADSRNLCSIYCERLSLSALLANWFQVKQWLSYAADGLTQYRVDVNLAAVDRDRGKSL